MRTQITGRPKAPNAIPDGTTSNNGWNPSTKGAQNAFTQFTYEPEFWEMAPTLDGGFPGSYGGGGNADVVIGFYRWTRGGLAGVDYGGTELKTTGWQ